MIASPVSQDFGSPTPGRVGDKFSLSRVRCLKPTDPRVDIASKTCPAAHTSTAAIAPAERAGYGTGRPPGLILLPAAQAPLDRHPGEHRPGAQVFRSLERHAYSALPQRRGHGVSGARAEARLEDHHVGRRTPLDGVRLELPRFPAGKVDRRAFSWRLATPLLERNTLSGRVHAASKKYLDPQYPPSPHVRDHNYVSR
jgi:hypothetical protein